MGGKNKEAGTASGKDMCKQDASPAKPGAVLPCEKPKHWIGVKVEDEDGKPVKDVTVHCKLNDGTAFSVDFSTAALEKDGSYQTKKVLDAATGDFTFPDLHNVEWWPKGGAAVAGSVTPAPAVAEGDCALSIADKLVFRNH